MAWQQTISKDPTNQNVGSELKALGFDEEELAALRQKGSIHQEQRGPSTVIFKLRYRLAGRQRVKYLGADRFLVERIKAQLYDLQTAHRRSRRLRQLGAQARTLLRETKVRMIVPLEQAGLKFHGNSIRRPRMRKEVFNSTNPGTKE